MKIPFTLSQLRPIREAMTVSRPAKLGESVPVTWFSLGGGTSITPEYYDCTTLYLGGEGGGRTADRPANPFFSQFAESRPRKFVLGVVSLY